MKKSNIFHLTYLLVFIVILIGFTFPVIFNMSKMVYGPVHNTDNRAAVWHFWWFNYSSQNNLDVKTNTLSSYPFGTGNMGPKVFPLCMIPAYILSATFNEFFAYNFLLIASFILSFLCMYILVFYLTKNHAAAFISGLIYSFCPYHFNKSWEHFGLTFIEFIPLYIYSLLKLKELSNLKHIVLCALSLGLVVLSDLTYAYIILVLSIFYLLFSFIYYTKRRSLIKEFIPLSLNFVKMGTLALLITVPLLMQSFKEIFLPDSNLALEGVKVMSRPFKYLFTQSGSILAYLLPSKYHPLSGGLARSLEGTIFFGRSSIEQSLYLGWIPLILAFIGYRQWKKKKFDAKNDFVIGLFIFTAIFGFIFSMPPYWNFLVFKVYFPSFFIYKIFPVFRAYARFGVIVILAVSILAGYGVSILVSVKRKRNIVFLLISFLVLFDFLNVPPLRGSEIKPPAVYQWLNKQKGDFAIIEYPLRLGDTAEGYVNLDYLLYQRFHQKALLNGGSPGTKNYAIKEKIAKVTDKKTPRILKGLGVKYAIIHLDKYRKGNNPEAVNVIGEVPNLSEIKGYKLVERIGDVEVYEVVAEGLKL